MITQTHKLTISPLSHTRRHTHKRCHMPQIWAHLVTEHNNAIIVYIAKPLSKPPKKQDLKPTTLSQLLTILPASSNMNGRSIIFLWAKHQRYEGFGINPPWESSNIC